MSWKAKEGAALWETSLASTRTGPGEEEEEYDGEWEGEGPTDEEGAYEGFPEEARPQNWWGKGGDKGKNVKPKPPPGFWNTEHYGQMHGKMDGGWGIHQGGKGAGGKWGSLHEGKWVWEEVTKNGIT